MQTYALSSPSPLESLLRLVIPYLPGGKATGIYRCDVVFGSPNAGCRATGICSISTMALQPRVGQCRRTAAAFVPGNKVGQVSLVLFRELMCAELWCRHFRKGVLEMTEPCALPESFGRHFQYKGTRLPAGTYRLEEMPGFYRIDFVLEP